MDNPIIFMYYLIFSLFNLGLLVGVPVFLCFKFLRNYEFFEHHKDYKLMYFEQLVFYSLRHLMDEKYGQLYHLNLVKTEIDIEDLEDWVFTMENYIKKFELDNEEKYECPICLLEFENDTKVIGLKCSKLHIYHSECLEKMLDS